MKMSVKSLRIYFVVVGVLGISVVVASLMVVGSLALMSIAFVSAMNPQCNANLLNSECLSPIGSALLSKIQLSALLWVLGFIVAVALSGAYLYIGIDLPSLLVKSPKLIRGIISVNIAYQVLTFIIGSSQSDSDSPMKYLPSIPLLISISIDSYLLNRIKQLAQEEKAKIQQEQ